jgi:HlyD family secretion protein
MNDHRHMNKKIYIGSGVLILIISLFFIFRSGGDKIDSSLYVKVQQGNMPIDVIATGELQAIRSQKIYAPSMLRSLGISQIKISNMADEGTILKKGDFVASLDPSEIGSKLSSLGIELDQKLSELKSVKLDTALTLRQEIENILTLKYLKEENELEVKQSIYEPPAVQRKAQITLEKSERNYDQAVTNLRLKRQQAESKVFKVQSELRQVQANIAKMEEGLQSLTVNAEQNGMLVYYTNWNGKIKPGATINTWNPIIASIPDLSEMISKTYVNEIDISKVKEGQKVKINIDAFPEKQLSGEIISIANIGQKISGGDAKVFEVEIKVNENDSILRPAMTTTNTIIIRELKDVLYLPIEGIFTEGNTQFVYLNKGGKLRKQEVETGESSAEFIEIKNGLKEEDEVSLVAPENSEELEIISLKKNA